MYVEELKQGPNAEIESNGTFRIAFKGWRR